MNPAISIDTNTGNDDTSIRALAAPQWDRFVPEYIGGSSDSPPPLDSNVDPHPIDRSIADLDI